MNEHTTYRLNDATEVLGWADGRGPKHYMARAQAERALAKLNDDGFEVWQPRAGRSFYLRVKQVTS